MAAPGTSLEVAPCFSIFKKDRDRLSAVDCAGPAGTERMIVITPEPPPARHQGKNLMDDAAHSQDVCSRGGRQLLTRNSEWI